MGDQEISPGDRVQHRQLTWLDSREVGVTLPHLGLIFLRNVDGTLIGPVEAKNYKVVSKRGEE